MTILTKIQQIINVPLRLEVIASQYICGLLIAQTHRVSLTLLAEMFAVNPSQFSRLLDNGHENIAFECLNRHGKRLLKKLNKRKRHKLMSGCPWTVLIIVDATLHRRSSRHLDNAQRFNHGDGWVIGHQWTNILLVINGIKIPLAPIPFLTEAKCQELKIVYQSEHERIIEYLSNSDFNEFLPTVKPEEILVLSDSGYDNKAFQKFILSKGWSFIASLKKTRSVCTTTQKQWQSIESFFKNTRKIGPQKTVRIKTNGGKKRKEVSTRALKGFLKGVHNESIILSVEKPDKKRLYLACSRKNTNSGAILRLYKMRWLIEIFHKEIKSYLGLEGPGLVAFESIHAHVLWVYVAYILLPELAHAPPRESLLTSKRRLQKERKIEEINEILLCNSRINARECVKKHCQKVKSRLKAA